MLNWFNDARPELSSPNHNHTLKPVQFFFQIFDGPKFLRVVLSSEISTIASLEQTSGPWNSLATLNYQGEFARSAPVFNSMECGLVCESHLQDLFSRLARSLVPPPSAESRRTAGEIDQNGSVSSGFMSRLGVLEKTGAPSEKHVQAPVRAARAVVFESSGAQGSASSQASADDAVVGDSGGKDEAAEATSGWTKRYVFAKISHSLAY